MEKDFLPYEQSLALKELGFNLCCIQGFYNKSVLNTIVSAPVDFNNKPSLGELVSCPLYSQAFRWFREEHNLYTEIYNCHDNNDNLVWDWNIIDDTIEEEEIDLGQPFSSSYEEAELSCLIALIETVKSKMEKHK